MGNTVSSRTDRPVAIWLLIGVGMIIVQVVLGGITRLTGSGLSITEWNVVTGTLPPLNAQQWLAEFDKYRETPQFRLLNIDFSLQDFQFIYFWEWFHRLWARLIGLVFFIPFVVFLLQRRFRPSMVRPMIVLFLLGALQGAVGWIMVASGLSGDAVYVKPTRLALHFVFALGLLAYTFWFALRLLVPDRGIPAGKGIRMAWNSILVILVLQLIYGALMAGHRAALAAPTWPDINGRLLPASLFREGWLSFIDNQLLIHFIHRGLAYLLLVLIIGFSIRLFRQEGTALFRRVRIWPLVLVLLQVVLGVLTVRSSLQIVPNRWGPFEWMAQLHQLTAMFLLLSLLLVRYLFQRPASAA